MVTNRGAYLGRLYASVNRVKLWLGLSFNPGMLAAPGTRWKTRGHSRDATRSETGATQFSFVLRSSFASPLLFNLPSSFPSSSLLPLQLSFHLFVRNFAKLCGNIYIYMFRVNRFIKIRINVLLFVCARYFSRQSSLQKTEKRISTNIEELCTCVYIGRRSLAKDKFREWGREGEEVRAVHCSVICSVFIIILCR